MVVGGTSARAPQWAGIMAIANEERVANRLVYPDASERDDLYDLRHQGKVAQDFHDVTSGRNTGGFSAMRATMPHGARQPGCQFAGQRFGHRHEATSRPTSTTKITIGSTQGSP